MDTAGARGEEFRQDLRAPGARNAQARRLLGAEELAPLTCLSTPRSLLAIGQTFGLIAAAVAFLALFRLDARGGGAVKPAPSKGGSLNRLIRIDEVSNGPPLRCFRPRRSVWQ